MIFESKEEFLQKLLEIVIGTTIQLSDVWPGVSLDSSSIHDVSVLIDNKEKKSFQFHQSDITGFIFETGRVAFYSKKFKLRTNSGEKVGRFSFDFIIDEDSDSEFVFHPYEDYNIDNRTIYFGCFSAQNLDKIEFKASGSLTKRAL